jgi:putative SOS response-associated peptidase YedK
MCGRYTLTRQESLLEDLEASLGTAAQSAWWKPRFNIAPTQPAPVVILRDGTRLVEMMRWGLVPHWATKPGAKPPLMINARVESLQDKPMFRDALARRRCLVPADGFYEWKRGGSRAKTPPQPMYIHPAPRHTIAFAGLWSRAHTEAGDQLSFTIVTCPPNELVAPIHDRMPIVLPPTAYAAWLDPSLDGEGARALLETPPSDGWVVDPVSTRVNTAQHDDPELIAPIALEAPAQRSLF